MRDEGDWTDRRVKPAVDFLFQKGNFRGYLTNMSLEPSQPGRGCATVRRGKATEKLVHIVISGKILLRLDLGFANDF